MVGLLLKEATIKSLAVHICWWKNSWIMTRVNHIDITMNLIDHIAKICLYTFVSTQSWEVLQDFNTCSILSLMSVWEVLQRQHFLKTYVMKQYTSRRLGQRNSYKLVKLHIVYFILSQAYADASRIRVHRCSCKFATTSKKIRTYICCISSRMIRLGYPGRQQDLNWDFNKEVHKFDLPEILINNMTTYIFRIKGQ
jgi:hypothetical protein